MFESCTMSLAYAKYSFLEMWVEALPGTAILFGCIYAGKFCTYYWQEAGRHKGAFAGGSPYIWGNGWKATGGKKLPRGAMNQHEYLAADNHTYGRTMQMSLEAHSTEWIHPTLMPMSMRIAAQQKNE